MRNIKKFTSVEDLEKSGLNLAPQEYYLHISEDGQGAYFDYYLPDDAHAQDANFTGTTQGIFNEITPGVAYLNTQESKSVLYNSKFKPIELSASARTWTWEEFGMTMDLYNKYLALAKAYAHPSVFNIFVDGNPVVSVEYSNSATRERLRFSSSCWGLVFDLANKTVMVNDECE